MRLISVGVLAATAFAKKTPVAPFQGTTPDVLSRNSTWLFFDAVTKCEPTADCAGITPSTGIEVLTTQEGDYIDQFKKDCSGCVFDVSLRHYYDNGLPAKCDKTRTITFDPRKLPKPFVASNDAFTASITNVRSCVGGAIPGYYNEDCTALDQSKFESVGYDAASGEVRIVAKKGWKYAQIIVDVTGCSVISTGAPGVQSLPIGVPSPLTGVKGVAQNMVISLGAVITAAAILA